MSPVLMSRILTSLQGDTENKVMAFAADHQGTRWEACVAKPALISPTGVSVKGIFLTALSWVGGQAIGVSECVAAIIDQLTNGFEKDPLTNADLVRLGRKVLETEGKT
jgi:hypothetical protein